MLLVRHERGGFRLEKIEETSYCLALLAAGLMQRKGKFSKPATRREEGGAAEDVGRSLGNKKTERGMTQYKAKTKRHQHK